MPTFPTLVPGVRRLAGGLSRTAAERPHNALATPPPSTAEDSASDADSCSRGKGQRLRQVGFAQGVVALLRESIYGTTTEEVLRREVLKQEACDRPPTKFGDLRRRSLCLGEGHIDERE